MIHTWPAGWSSRRIDRILEPGKGYHDGTFFRELEKCFSWLKGITALDCATHSSGLPEAETTTGSECTSVQSDSVEAPGSGRSRRNPMKQLGFPEADQWTRKHSQAPARTKS